MEGWGGGGRGRAGEWKDEFLLVATPDAEFICVGFHNLGPHLNGMVILGQAGLSAVYVNLLFYCTNLFILRRPFFPIIFYHIQIFMWRVL